MLLITMNEWLGPGRKMTPENASRTDSHERLITFATHLSLGEAIERISNYEQAFNAHYFLAVNFRLLQVMKIDDNLTPQQLTSVDVQLVENLYQKSEDFI